MNDIRTPADGCSHGSAFLDCDACRLEQALEDRDERISVLITRAREAEAELATIRQQLAALRDAMGANLARHGRQSQGMADSDYTRGWMESTEGWLAKLDALLAPQGAATKGTP